MQNSAKKVRLMLVMIMLLLIMMVVVVFYSTVIKCSFGVKLKFKSQVHDLEEVTQSL